MSRFLVLHLFFAVSPLPEVGSVDFLPANSFLVKCQRCGMTLRLVVGSWVYDFLGGFRMTFAAYMSTDLNTFSVKFSMLTEASVSISLCRL